MGYFPPSMSGMSIAPGAGYIPIPHTAPLIRARRVPLIEGRKDLRQCQRAKALDLNS